MSDPQATRKFRFKAIIICFFSLLALALVVALIVHLVNRRPWGRKWYKYRKHYWWKRSDKLLDSRNTQILDLRGVGRQAELQYGYKINRRSLPFDKDSIWKRAKVMQLQ